MRGRYSFFSSPGPQGLAVDKVNHHLWISEHHRGGAGEEYICVDITSGELLGRYPSTLSWPEGLAFDSGLLYLIGAIGSRLYIDIIDVFTEPHIVRRRIDTGFGRETNGMTVYGDKIVFPRNENALYFMDIETGSTERVPAPVQIIGVAHLIGNLFIATHVHHNVIYLLELVEEGAHIDCQNVSTPKDEIFFYPNPANSVVGFSASIDDDIHVVRSWCEVHRPPRCRDGSDGILDVIGWPNLQFKGCQREGKHREK